MNRYRLLFLVTAGALACSTLPASGADIRLQPLLQLRWRQEVSNQLSANPALDERYATGHLRERFGFDARLASLTLHALAQAAQSYDVPRDAASGPGAAYFNASNRDTSPAQIDLAELSLAWRPAGGFSAAAGRLSLQDGAETTTGDARLDWVKQNRVAERLIGTWDWPNVARRFDGLALGVDRAGWNVSGFGARILQGGFNYADAFEPLDDVKTAGLSATLKPGAWLPHTEARAFTIAYRDARPVTRAALGDRLFITTLGFDVAGAYPLGAGVADGLLWAAYQVGDYGAKRQAAGAFLIEGGYGWPEARWKPWLRSGVNYAGGGDPGSDTHRTFVNLAPTNHKFYGIQDLNAFQNLTDLFAQVMIQPAKPVKIALEGHLFRLSSRADAWYGGSGPVNNSAFGIAGRTAPGGLDRSIGSEVDLVVTLNPVKRLALQLGLSHFEGGGTARKVFPVHSDADFFYVQTVFQY